MAWRIHKILFKTVISTLLQHFLARKPSEENHAAGIIDPSGLKGKRSGGHLDDTVFHVPYVDLGKAVQHSGLEWSDTYLCSKIYDRGSLPMSEVKEVSYIPVSFKHGQEVTQKNRGLRHGLWISIRNISSAALRAMVHREHCRPPTTGGELVELLMVFRSSAQAKVKFRKRRKFE